MPAFSRHSRFPPSAAGLLMAMSVGAIVGMLSHTSVVAAADEALSGETADVQTAPKQAETDLPPAGEGQDEIVIALRNIRRRWAEAVFQRGVSECVLGQPRMGQQHLLAAWMITDADDPHRKSYARVLEAQLLADGHLGMAMRQDNAVIMKLSPDGTRIVTGSYPALDPARLWDARTGARLGELPISSRVGGPSSHYVNDLAFSPDGTRIIMAVGDRTTDQGGLRLHHGRTGAPLAESQWQKLSITNIFFSADGTRIYTDSGGGYSNVGEARVWDGQTGRPLFDPLRHAGRSTTTLSADGRHGLTLWDNPYRRDPLIRNVRFQRWDARTGSPLGEPLAIASQSSDSAISPDGTRLVVQVDDHSLQLWDTSTGQTVGKPIPYTDPLRDGILAFSPDSSRLLVVMGDKTSQLWDSRTATPVAEPISHQGKIRHAEFSADGTRFATAADRYEGPTEIQVWNTDDATPRGEPISHTGEIADLEFSPDGMRLAVTVELDDATETRHATGKTRLWDIWTGEQLGQTMSHPEYIDRVRFSADGTKLVTHSVVQVQSLWDGRTGAPLANQMHLDGVDCDIEFHPDGVRALIGSGSFEKGVRGDVRQWDVQGSHARSELMGHHKRLESADFSPDGTRIVTAAEGIAQLWIGQTAIPLKRMANAETDSDAGVRNNVKFSPDGTRILTTSQDAVEQWDGQTGAPLGKPLVHGDAPKFAVFSPDGSRIVTKSKTAMRLWNSQTSAPVASPLPVEQGEVQMILFSPDSQHLLTTLNKKTFQLWDTRTGKPVGPPMAHSFEKHAPSPLQPVFSPDGSRLLTGIDHSTAQLWNAQTGAALSQLTHAASPLTRMVFSPDSRHVVTAWETQTGFETKSGVQQWDAQTGKFLADLARFDEPLTNLKFSPDGKRLLMSTQSSTQLWDSQTGTALAEPLSHPAADFLQGQFIADGTRLMTICNNDLIRFWDSRTGALLTEFQLRKPSYDIHASSDGMTLLIDGLDGSPQARDGLTGAPLGPPLLPGNESTSEVNHFEEVQFSSDGTRILVSDASGIQIFDLPTRPLPPDPLVLWECELGVRANSDGRIDPLSNAERDEREKILAAQSEWLAELAQQVQHRNLLTRRQIIVDAEALKDWYGMAYHLLRLPASERELPINQERLAYAMNHARRQQVTIPTPAKAASDTPAQ